MSDKLKIMQQPVVRKPMLDAGSPWDDSGKVFYKVVTCGVQIYYIEVTACRGSLSAVIERLMSDFQLDASRYCRSCDEPFVAEISVVSRLDVPEAYGQFIFVSRMH
jgi:hypothetical protein